MNWTDFGAKTPPFVAVLLNFAILAGGYYFLGRKPIGNALKSRRDSIANDIEEAERARAAAEERAKFYQAKLEKLEDEVRAAREALVRAGEAEGERIVSDAEAKAERLRSDARFLVEQELKQARQDLWREAVEAAVAGAQQLLASRVTPADQERLAEDYLANLGGQKGPNAAEPQAARETES
jgi:F-type H+-transporting ATPase subunit b